MSEVTYLVSPDIDNRGYMAVGTHPAELLTTEVVLAPTIDELLRRIIAVLETYPPDVEGITLKFKLIKPPT